MLQLKPSDSPTSPWKATQLISADWWRLKNTTSCTSIRQAIKEPGIHPSIHPSIQLSGLTSLLLSSLSSAQLSVLDQHGWKQRRYFHHGFLVTQIYSSQALSSIISTISSVGQKKSESDTSRSWRNQPMVSCCRNSHLYHVSIRIPIILDNPQVHHYSYVVVLSTGILYIFLSLCICKLV